MAETAFFILGAAAVVAALVLSTVGLRRERFPGSRAAVAGVAVLFGALVVATGTFAWIHAEEEHRDHAAEHAEARAAAQAERAAEMRAQTDPVVEDDATADVSGQQVFDTAGCASCHTLEAAGSVATTGPDLDEVLPGRSADEIERLIVDPGSEVTPGFPAGLMPENYDETLSQAELEALVEFLVESTG